MSGVMGLCNIARHRVIVTKSTPFILQLYRRLDYKINNYRAILQLEAQFSVKPIKNIYVCIF